MKARERVSMAGWARVKPPRRQLRNYMMRVRVPLICNFRAEEKTKPVEQEKNGRKIAPPTNLGWQPIAPVQFVHLMDLFCLLPLRANGVPTWTTGNDYADFALKLPEFFKPLFELPHGTNEAHPINEAQGTAMALWARGQQWGPEHDSFLIEAQSQALNGYATFGAWWARQDREYRVMLGPERFEQLKAAARAVDNPNGHKAEHRQEANHEA